MLFPVGVDVLGLGSGKCQMFCYARSKGPVSEVMMICRGEGGSCSTTQECLVLA